MMKTTYVLETRNSAVGLKMNFEPTVATGQVKLYRRNTRSEDFLLRLLNTYKIS